MGCAFSTSAEDWEAKARNDEIESQLKRDRAQSKNEVKMLLLGAGESGKSTVLKQMKLIHDGGYSPAERDTYKEIIFSNVVQSMRAVLEALPNLNLSLAPNNESNKDYILSLPFQVEAEILPPTIATSVQALLEDPSVREAVHRSSEYQLNDSASYFFFSLSRIASPSFVPTDQDILRSRVRTTGITETRFRVGELSYAIFDVGGQRSERKKWIHCFENVTALVFLVGLSEYDQVLAEDEDVNRLQEALTLFESICNSRWFTKTSIILFLNKIDLFSQKLSRSPLNEFFPDFQGGDNYEAACDYLLSRFLSLNRSQASKQVYAHFTCATDTNQIKFVLTAVEDILLRQHLESCMML